MVTVVYTGLHPLKKISLRHVVSLWATYNTPFTRLVYWDKSGRTKMTCGASTVKTPTRSDCTSSFRQTQTHHRDSRIPLGSQTSATKSWYIAKHMRQGRGSRGRSWAGRAWTSHRSTCRKPPPESHIYFRSPTFFDNPRISGNYSDFSFDWGTMLAGYHTTVSSGTHPIIFLTVTNLYRRADYQRCNSLTVSSLSFSLPPSPSLTYLRLQFYFQVIHR